MPSSSEYSNNNSYYVYMREGYVGMKPKNSQDFYVRPFLAVGPEQV